MNALFKRLALRLKAAIPYWNTLGLMLSNNTARFIYALPLAGYVILYSDYFQSLFHFQSLSRSSWGFLTFTERINFIYYGSWILLIAFGLYWAFCPSKLKGKRDIQHFISEIVISRDVPTVRAIASSSPFRDSTPGEASSYDVAREELMKAVELLAHRGSALGQGAGEFDADIPTILSVYYRYYNSSAFVARLTVSGLSAIGYLLVLVLPSADLLLRVLGTQYHQLIS